MAARHKGDTKSGDRQSNKRELRPYGSLYAHSPFRRDASCYYLCGQCALRYLNVTWFSTENVGAHATVLSGGRFIKNSSCYLNFIVSTGTVDR